MASRLRRTHTFKKRHFAPRVSSTPNAHSKNQVSSRLRQMPFVLKKGRLAYTKSLLGEATPSRGEPSRAGPLAGDQRWLTVRSRKIAFAQKKTVSPTPNASFSGLHFLSCGQCRRYSILPRSCTLQLASRLRRTHVFAKLQFPTVASSTPNAHFANQVSSRLHQTRTIFKK